MNEDECKALTAKWQEKVKGTVVDIAYIQTVHTTSRHPFTIGPEHVGFAADHYGGMLGQACLDDPKCPGCAGHWKDLIGDEEYDKIDQCSKPRGDPIHKSELACYVRVNRACTCKEVTDVTFPIKGEMEKDGIIGFAFVNHQDITDWGQK